MIAYSYTPLVKLQEAVINWRLRKNIKDKYAMPDCIQMTYEDFVVIWKQCEEYYSDKMPTPSLNELKLNPLQYKLFNMRVVIND